MAFGTSALALVCLAALVVVASLHNAETLATVALSLAILAFLVQLLVFLGQSAAQTQQTTRSEDIYGRTLELLADIQASGHHTQEALKEQRELLLPALLAKADLQRPPSDGQSADYTQTAAELSYPPRVRSTDDFRVARQLESFPKDRAAAERIAQELSSLDNDFSLEWLARMAQDEWIIRTDPSIAISFGLYSARNDPWTAELWQHGLIQLLGSSIIDRSDPNQEFFVLTDWGRECGRVLIAKEPLPAELEGIEFPTVDLDD